MIPYDLDPSLHSGEPQPQWLDDGFSPRPGAEPEAAHDFLPDTSAGSAASARWTQSEF